MDEECIKVKMEDNDSGDDIESTLASILQEVKKEEKRTSISDDEQQSDRDKDKSLPENFFDDLYREELERDPDEATSDLDIEKLQEILLKRKRVLNDADKTSENKRKSRKDKTGSSSKRSRTNVDTQKENSENDNPVANENTEMTAHSSGQDGFSTVESETSRTNDPELELEQMLETEDFKICHGNASINYNQMQLNGMQQMYGLPNGIPMMFNTTGQMLNTTPFPIMGCHGGFYPTNIMSNMQMMGPGFSSQMNPPSNEVECLPVISAPSLSNIPFKRIKLERATEKISEPPPEDHKKKIITNCTKLLEEMEFSECGGKFVYTPTVIKNDDAVVANSVLMKITNVMYDFQSIGPKQNLQDYGLKGIPNANAEIAKRISMNADKYFKKISQNVNTIARKMVKEEATKADKKLKRTEQMEVEELSVPSYLKTSGTQTEPLTCKECVARKRIVGHPIGVQTSVFSFSIGTQTIPEARFSDQLTEGLTNNQMKALYEFSLLIREPPKNTSQELIRLREQLINMYNLSQRQHNGPVPFVDASATLKGYQNTMNQPRIENPAAQQISMHDPRQNASNYSQQHLYRSGMIHQDRSNVLVYPQESIPSQYSSSGGRDVSENPSYRSQNFQGEGKRNYGRGGHRR